MHMSRKVISAGHICLDITPVFPGGHTYSEAGELLAPGKLIQLAGTTTYTGGSVGNSGLALKVLGADVTLLGKVGDDAFGSAVKSITGKYGAFGLITDPAVSTSYTIVLAIPGIDRIFVIDTGANDTFSGSDIPEEALEDVCLFHYGYPPVMKKFYSDEGQELSGMYRRMKDHGIATSLDMSYIDPDSPAGKANWRAILEKTLPYTDLFLPSYEDICGIFGEPDPDAVMDKISSALSMAEEMIDMGAAVVMVKCGTQGICYRTADRSRIEKIGPRLAIDADAWADQSGIQKSFKAPRVLSATAAGDAAIAAFLKAVLDGYGPAGSVRFAAAEGCCAVTTYDTLSGLKTLDELEAMIAAGWETN